ncbi:ATP-dependent RNA helicase, putative [Eimeria maxima]|uniref:ATP-dependent RNA helicase, putative n=1 Tax=Eimeria maxima TaxID=5804 RepID=U6LZY1_EIMMA|nr:ATP-dependent RNA helicase, putative [Eimeria maxima]CDJ56408.1 ATP-dependent RNA helicase, putative [Eimeria maxima]
MRHSISHLQLARIVQGTGLSHSVWIGGVSATEQVQEINNKQIDIGVCTPGRVDELCLRGKVSLEFVQLLVLDEADAMLDLGFQKVIRQI